MSDETWPKTWDEALAYWLDYPHLWSAQNSSQTAQPLPDPVNANVGAWDCGLRDTPRPEPVDTGDRCAQAWGPDWAGGMIIHDAGWLVAHQVWHTSYQPGLGRDRCAP